MNSPTLKEFGEERIASGESCLVVDLAACTGMDSTFMGTLAGLAARLATAEDGVLQVAQPGERNRRSLEDLGLDFLMKIDPVKAEWQDEIEEIRASLKPPRAVAKPGDLQRAALVLEAHQVLSNANEGNARKFSGVVSLLEAELAEKRKEK
ncbi:MAG: STAS domain-containing protein [Luteolibacter sp.]